MEFTDKIDFTEGTKLTWPLKILFFFGGLITMSSMLGFFALLFTNPDECFISCFGICMLIGSIAMTRMIDSEKLILAVAYPLWLTGHLFFEFGICDIYSVGTIIFINLCVLTIGWIFCQNHFMRQVFLLAIFILIPLIFIDTHDDIFIKYLFFYYAILLLGVYGLTIMNDADKFDKESLYANYISTIRFCTVVTAIGYALFAIDHMTQSIICAIFSFIVACVILSEQTKNHNKSIIYIALAFLGCAASCITPNMSLAVLGLILTYSVLDKFGIVAFGIFIIYSISKFYYDLEMLLSHKSYLLMASGIVFLSLFYFIKKLAK